MDLMNDRVNNHLARYVNETWDSSQESTLYWLFVLGQWEGGSYNKPRFQGF